MVWAGPAVAMESHLKLDARDPYLKIESALSVGNKGEETFDVSLRNGETHCGPVWAFDHAKLEIIHNRYGDVQFVELPRPGCISCIPGRVRWYHEPTGNLAFTVHVYRRLAHKPCPGQAGQSNTKGE